MTTEDWKWLCMIVCAIVQDNRGRHHSFQSGLQDFAFFVGGDSLWRDESISCNSPCNVTVRYSPLQSVAFLFVNTTFSFSSQCWQFVASLIRLRAISIMACATDIIWSMLPALMASKSFPSASCNRTPEALRAFRCSVSATVISPSCFCNCSVSSLLNLPRFHFDLTKKSFIFRSLYGFI